MPIRIRVLTEEQKAARREYHRQYRQTHAAQVKQYQKDYYARNPEYKQKILQASRDRHQANSRVDLDYTIYAKIQTYKQSDRKYNRVSRNFDYDSVDPQGERRYINPQWVKDELARVNNKCHHCGGDLKLTHYEKNDPDQFSVDRIFNDLPHEPLNCVVSHLRCNLKHGPADAY